MALQQGRDLHIDAVLSGIMVGRRHAQGIVQDLVPVVPVGKQSNIYMKSNFREALQWVPGLTERARGAKSREIYFTVSSDTYFAKNYALGGRTYDEEEVNSDDPIKLRSRTARMVTDRLLVDYEARVAGICSSTSNVSTTHHVATAWSNVTGSRPFSDLSDDIEAFRAVATVRPNLLIMPEQVAQKVRKSDEVRDMLFGDKGGIATDDQIAALLKINKILVPEIFVNTMGPGETMIGSGNANPVWGNKVYLAYVADLKAEEEADTWITAFRWTDPKFGVPFGIRVFAHDDERRSEKVEASYYQAEKCISSDLGWAIDSVI